MPFNNAYAKNCMISFAKHSHQNRPLRVPESAEWSQACSYSNSRTSETYPPEKKQKKQQLII